MASIHVTKENVGCVRELVLANARILFPINQVEVVLATNSDGSIQAAIVQKANSVSDEATILMQGPAMSGSMEAAIGALLNLTSEAVGELLKKI